eukprot:jgi/Mesen1/6455/ME000033S05740
MGLPKPLGPYHVSFGDYELKRNIDLRSLSEQSDDNVKATSQNSRIEPETGGVEEETSLPPAPLFRIYYPTAKAPSSWSWGQVTGRRWLPSVHYAYGHLCMLFRPTTWGKRALCWLCGVLAYVLIWPFSAIHASVAMPPLAPQEGEGQGASKGGGGGGVMDGKGRMPVVVFSHGAWSTRATYSALCCDLASHGFVVAAVEHLDGSACMARYTAADGTHRWQSHDPLDIAFPQVPVEHRQQQLEQRVGEARQTLSVLEALDAGHLSGSSNAVTGSGQLDVASLKGRLDLRHVAVAGHSFGGATAAVLPGVDARFRCSLVLDCWWRPMKDAGFERAAGGMPVLCVQTEGFKYAALTAARHRFFQLRQRAPPGTVTELQMIKGTNHNDQSDITVLLPRLTKRLGLAGSLDPMIAREINSSLCLQFLLRNLLPPGRGDMKSFDNLSSLSQYIVVGTADGVLPDE